MIAGLEKEFGLKIPDSDVNPRKFESVERIEAYLASRGVSDGCRTSHCVMNW